MTDLRLRALQYLTRREYSRAELRSKLAGEAESEEALDGVLDKLQLERFFVRRAFCPPAGAGAFDTLWRWSPASRTAPAWRQ
jgi:hypothetical protein